MYKNRSRSKQRGINKFEREHHVFSVEGIPTDDAERRRFFSRVAKQDPKKLGGWPLAKFAAAQSHFRLECHYCGFMTKSRTPGEFNADFTKQPEGTRLIIIKRMARCPRRCNPRGGNLTLHISLGEHLLKF